MAHQIIRNEAPDNQIEASGSQLMNQIEALEAAKRRAASSYTRMVAHPLPQATAQVTLDEQDVLCARVGVLNALLRQPSENPLCLEATGRKGPRLCVTYDRLRCEGELELGPMQSTLAWAVRDAEDAVMQLMSSPDSHPPAQAVKTVLDFVRQSAPKKDILQGLHAALAMPAPERLVLKSLQGVNALETDGHTRVYEGLGEASGPTPPLYRVVWGALSLDVLEGWQNPSTNAAIRLSILHAAHQAARDAQQTKAPRLSNVAYLQVRIYHGDECHRMSLRPFWDSESCTVSHIQFKQSVFDDSGPERGLLNLGSDPSSIHPIPLGTMLPLEAYVCLGAHRKSRLSEAQLNYVHAQGLLAHGFDTKLLPDPARLLQVQPGRMPPAKATRVSGDKLDVMASSYHLGDQVYTTISVVQYPPFGTQFEKARTDANTEVKPRRLRGRPEPRPSLAVLPLNPNSAEFEGSIWNTGMRAQPGEDRQEKEFNTVREDNIDAFGTKQWTWDRPLCLGEHFFIDGLYGTPYNIAFRFILFEMDNGLRYQTVQHKLKQIKAVMYELFQDNGWDPTLSFYGNIDTNEEIHNVWNAQWTDFLRNSYIEVAKDKKDEDNYSLAFWVAHHFGNWAKIFYKNDEYTIKNKYIRFQKEHLQHWTDTGHIDEADVYMTASPKQTQLITGNGQIPLPRLSARTDPAVSQLQSRIAALESKLGQAKLEENTQFLLAKVLDKLDAIEEV
jgi:hypothetical protein